LCSFLDFQRNGADSTFNGSTLFHLQVAADLKLAFKPSGDLNVTADGQVPLPLSGGSDAGNIGI